MKINLKGLQPQSSPSLFSERFEQLQSRLALVAESAGEIN
jgi:hypothetical protein